MPDHPHPDTIAALEAVDGSPYRVALATVFDLVGEPTASRWARARPAVVESIVQDVAFDEEYSRPWRLGPQERVILRHRAALHPGLAA